MNTPANPPWSTASFGEAVDTSPLELSALGEHLELCQGSRGRLFVLRCLAEAFDAFMAPRLVTTLVAAAALVGVVAWAL